MQVRLALDRDVTTAVVARRDCAVRADCAKTLCWHLLCHSFFKML